MNRATLFLLLFVCLVPGAAQSPSPASLRGVVTDPSRGAVQGAVIELRGPGGEHRATTDYEGRYSFPVLGAGKYRVRILAKGFSEAQRKDLAIERATVLDAQLAIEGGKQVLNVEAELTQTSTEPEANGGAVILRGRQIAALSDDPDELALQLQALAGPSPGPDGGQLFIDGFDGINLPPKASIREVRINANPFSPEYDRPGFSRIEIFTKPGSDSLRGQAFFQYNSDFLNSRNPLVTESMRPPYRARLYGFNLSGPVRKGRASFTLDAERRQIDENAYILATTLDSTLTPLAINDVLATPQVRTMVSPKVDIAINQKNTLAVRYQDLRVGLDNLGVGDFNLASRAYDEKQSEHTVQLTETAVLGPRAMNETRFQYSRVGSRHAAKDTSPAVIVQGAFASGGATVGNSSSTTNSWELTNVSTLTRGKHMFKWGGRARQALITDTSFNNFAGTFTFYTLAEYQAALGSGGSASQFSLNSGPPVAKVNQFDAGVFANDDWRARPNLTVSFGLRYEAQTNAGSLSDWAPRLAIAWGLDAKSKRPAKTVLRAGFGTFYDRIPLSATLNALRYNGATQQSYVILNAAFFPVIPSPGELQASQQPQQLRPIARGIAAPRIYQTSVGIDRQLGRSSRATVTWIDTRGVHLLNSRNVNTPLGGAYPYGDRSIRLLTESAGLSRLNQVVANLNVNTRKLFLFGYYALSYGSDNNEGLPADPYQLRAEWGPSFGDVRHRGVIGTTIPLPWHVSASPFIVANSGQPYNITTGLDPNSTGFPSARPALVAGGKCTGSGLVYAAEFGCFNLTPAPGSPTIGRNYGRGPGAVNVALRIARTWAFGGEGQTGASTQGSSHSEMTPPAGMFDSNSGRKYNLTLSASTMNALNHANFAPPNGDLSSSYFGQYRSLGGLMVMSHGGAASTYNRKIDLQLRFTF